MRIHPCVYSLLLVTILQASSVSAQGEWTADMAGPPIKLVKSPKEFEAEFVQKMSGADATARFERAGDHLLFFNRQIGLCFLSEEHGMGLTNIIHVRRRIGFGPKHPGGVRGLLWRLRFMTDGGRGEPFDMTSRSSANTKASSDARRLTLAWQGLDLPNEPKAVDVVVTIDLPNDSPAAQWRITIRNRSERWGIWDVTFPEIDLGHIGDSPENDHLLIPRAEGRLMDNPIHKWKRGFGVGASQPHGLQYPGGAQMQLAAYYEKEGSYLYAADRGPGLYMATHDGKCYLKIFCFTQVPDADTLACEVLNHPEDMGKPGKDYELPYPFICRVFDGDWFDAATIYREWAAQQVWCRKGPFRNREDIPDWFKDVTYFYRCDTRGNSTPSAMRQMLDETRTALGPPVAAHWYYWMRDKSLAFVPLEYLPPKEGIAEAWRGTTGKGIFIFPYVNCRIWNRESPTFPQVLPYTIKDPFGKCNVWSTEQYADMCRYTKWYQDLMADVCKRLVTDYGAGGIYLDQIGAAYSSLCFDKSHGHPLGGGTYAVEGSREIFMRVHDATGGAPVLSEASSEENIDVSAGKIIHYNIWPGFVPLFSAVYHDYWSFYGRSLTPKPDDRIGYMQAGMLFVIGAQLGRIWPGTVHNGFLGRPKGDARYAAFVKKLIDAKRAAKEFLGFGRMLRPPRFVGELPNVTTTSFEKLGGRVTMPAVLAGVWQSVDGRVGIALTNVSDAEVPCRFILFADDWSLPRDRDIVLRKIAGDPQWEDERRRPDDEISLRLPAESVLVLEVSAP